MTALTHSWYAGDAIAVSGALIVAVLAWSGMRALKNKRNFPPPPGPKGFMLIGNMFDIPKEREWLTYTDWGKKYGILSSTTDCDLHLKCFKDRYHMQNLSVFGLLF